MLHKNDKKVFRFLHNSICVSCDRFPPITKIIHVISTQCVKKVLRFQISIRERFCNSFSVRVIRKSGKTTVIQISAVCMTL